MNVGQVNFAVSLVGLGFAGLGIVATLAGATTLGLFLTGMAVGIALATLANSIAIMRHQ